MYSEKLFSALIKFVIVVVVIRFVVFGNLFNAGVYKGSGYSIVPPPGWQEVKDSRAVQAMMETYEKPDVATFVAPETAEMGGEEVPAASLSILTVKLAQPTWMDDEFLSLVEAVGQAGYRIIDKGQIEIDTQIFHWIFYQNPFTSWVNLEFYMVNDMNKLYKVQFAADPAAFDRYRPDFEKAKDTLKISTALW